MLRPARAVLLALTCALAASGGLGCRARTPESAPESASRLLEMPSPAAPPPNAHRGPRTALLVLTPLVVTTPVAAEDGRGGVVDTASPLALDVRGDRPWPARAQDPVLSIGALRFRRYAYASPDTLRFIVASRTALSQGGDVSVQYGDDERSRVTVTHGAWP